MNIKCIFGFHKWAGCKCSVCDEARNEGHDWSKDCEKCFRCGATRHGAHDWSGCKCSACGKTRDQDHDWSKDCQKCVRCGANLSRALIAASNQGKTDAVKLLLAHGAAVNAKDDCGGTALMHASRNGHYNAVEVLLGFGAEVNAKDNSGNTALMEACGAGWQDTKLFAHATIAYLSLHSASVKPDWFAKDLEAQRVVQALLTHGAEVNAKDNSGNTALLAATENGLCQAAELLLAHGAAPLGLQECVRCSGRGAIEVDSGNTLAGGRGYNITKACPVCHGLGKVLPRL